MGHGGGGIEAGKAFIRFLLDDKELKTGLAGVGRQMSKFGSIGMAATLPIIAAFALCVHAAANLGGELHAMSQRTGISAESLSALKFAADQTETSMEAVELAVRKMQKQLGGAKAGDEFDKGLRSIGLNLRDLKAMKPEDQFTAIATAIGQIEDPTMRSAMAQKFFGKGGTALLPMITDLRGGVAGLTKMARDFGFVLTDEDVAACAAMGRSLKLVAGQVTMMAVNVGLAIAGPLTDFLGVVSDVFGWVVKLIHDFPELSKVVGEVTGVVFGLSFASFVAGVAAQFLAWGVGRVTKAIGFFGIALTFIERHPIIAALIAIGLTVAWLARHFQWAYDKVMGLAHALQSIFKPIGWALEQVAKVVSGVGGFLFGSSVNASSTGSSAPVLPTRVGKLPPNIGAGATGPKNSITSGAADVAMRMASGGMGEVVKWTSQTAENTAGILQVLRQSKGFIAGSG